MLKKQQLAKKWKKKKLIPSSYYNENMYVAKTQQHVYIVC